MAFGLAEPDRLPRHREVDRAAVGGGRCGHILGPFEPPLNLEAGDAGGDEFGHLLHRHQVLRREQILGIAEIVLLAVEDEVVGQAAGLRALAAVGAAAAPGLARETLAAVGDAEGAMHKDLDLHGRGGGDLFDLGDGEFACEHHPLHAQAGGPGAALRGGDGHLRGAVDGELGRKLTHEAYHAGILDDDRIDAGVGHHADPVGDGRELVVEDEGVEGHKALHAAGVEGLHHLGELFGREVGGAGAGGEVGEAEVDGVGARLDGGAELGPAPDRGEEFGLEGAGHRGSHDGSAAAIPKFPRDGKEAGARRRRATAAVWA